MKASKIIIKFVLQFQDINVQTNTEDSCTSFDESDHEHETGKKHIWTRQIFSYEPYFVHEKMLRFQGHVYSPADIAKFWKKDCRTWLWKNGDVKEKRIKIKKVLLTIDLIAFSVRINSV